MRSCTGAQTITPNGTCYSGTTVGANDNWPQVAGCQDGNNNSFHPDVWFSFTSTGTHAQINITTSAPWAGNVEMILVQPLGGSCSAGFSLVDSIADLLQIIFRFQI